MVRKKIRWGFLTGCLVEVPVRRPNAAIRHSRGIRIEE